jgi:hypothetical protein
MKNTGLFINNKELMEVTFASATDKKGGLVVAKDTNSFDKGAGVTNTVEHTVRFRQASYRDNVEILSMTLKTKGDDVEIDPALLRYERFCALVKEWTLTDADGEAVKVNRNNIDKLNPDVAAIIMDRFDEVVAAED